MSGYDTARVRLRSQYTARVRPEEYIPRCTPLYIPVRVPTPVLHPSVHLSVHTAGLPYTLLGSVYYAAACRMCTFKSESVHRWVHKRDLSQLIVSNGWYTFASKMSQQPLYGRQNLITVTDVILSPAPLNLTSGLV